MMEGNPEYFLFCPVFSSNSHHLPPFGLSKHPLKSVNMSWDLHIMARSSVGWQKIHLMICCCSWGTFQVALTVNKLTELRKVALSSCSLYLAQYYWLATTKQQLPHFYLLLLGQYITGYATKNAFCAPKKLCLRLRFKWAALKACQRCKGTQKCISFGWSCLVWYISVWFRLITTIVVSSWLKSSYFGLLWQWLLCGESGTWWLPNQLLSPTPIIKYYWVILIALFFVLTKNSLPTFEYNGANAFSWPSLLAVSYEQILKPKMMISSLEWRN